MIEKKVREMWASLDAPAVDLSCDAAHLIADIERNGEVLPEVRKWARVRKKRKTLATTNTYALKHDAERDLGCWVPHSVFVFALYLEGFTLNNFSFRGEAVVFRTNLGAKKCP